MCSPPPITLALEQSRIGLDWVTEVVCVWAMAVPALVRFLDNF